VADRNTHPLMLDAIAVHHADALPLLRSILAHPNVGGVTLAKFVGTDNAVLLDAIAQNQRALGGCPEVARKLLVNPYLDHALRGRIASLFGETETSPRLDEPLPETGSEPEEGAPFEAAETSGEETSGEEFSAEESPIEKTGGEEEAFLSPEEIEKIELPSDIPEELLGDDREVSDGKNIFALVQKLSIAEKIKLATLGSKSARRILARDTNRLVVTAVVRSPKIREDEIAALAQDKAMPDDVILYILQRKDWLKNYPIRMGLCQNPKTPIPRALRLLETLSLRDLRNLSKSRNVPGAVSAGALRMLSKKSHQ
jgi:hypothetical protein